jgi:hypothetical protein
LKNPVKTANPSNAWNDEYDHGSISDDDLPNSARRNRGHGITDGNFDFDDFPVRGGKSGRTVSKFLGIWIWMMRMISLDLRTNNLRHLDQS